MSAKGPITNNNYLIRMDILNAQYKIEHITFGIFADDRFLQLAGGITIFIHTQRIGEGKSTPAISKIRLTKKLSPEEIRAILNPMDFNIEMRSYVPGLI